MQTLPLLRQLLDLIVRLAPSTKEKIDFFVRHPLTLSLSEMLLGSLLIPWIVGRTGVRRSHTDRRKHIVSARPDCQLRRRAQSDPGTAAARTAQCCRQPVARR